MSKREARSFAAAGVDIDAPRAKRRKEAPATSSDGKQDAENNNTEGDTQEGEENAVPTVEDKEEVREKGLQLWQTVKDAVNKEGQIASFVFMRLPSKRQYPDYYVQIKHPMALDDIKSKLDSREYTSIKDVRQDFETCFRNAKRYNMKESQIFKDAKFLHKLVLREFSRITGIKEEGQDDGDGSDDEEKKKKSPTAYRLLKGRLQKLIEKTDDIGRVLSSEFMDLPSRKEWPMYYTIIKRPQCFENIFKRLKRKEYPKPVDFANDVELIFSNALEFNQEHTQIWNDAVVLREYFRKLMSDLPEPFTIPAYANAGEHSTKIKLRMPQTNSAAPSTAASATSLPSTNAIMVPGSRTSSTLNLQASMKKDVKPATANSSRLPTAVKAPSTTPSIPSIPSKPTPVSTQPSSSSTAPHPTIHAVTPSIPTIAPQAQKTAHTPTLQHGYPQTATTNGGALYSSPYQPHGSAPVPSVSPAISSMGTTALPGATASPAVTRSPPPPSTAYVHPLKHAVITTIPHCRRLVLTHATGTRTWAMRLNGHETGIVVSDVVFLDRAHGDEEDESSGDDEPLRHEEEEEEEEEAVPVNVKKRGPGRPRKRGKAPKSPKKTQSKGKSAETAPGPLQVRLNGVLFSSREDETWEIQLPYGLSILEVGEKGGMVWKVYMDRAAA